ncbi:hypothetical protein [Hydrogenophaga sp.]|uniref:hypothetical protein n=1 Tax=Hydrogenophaga sp. TaxID=1904254 RepID=UPI0035AF6C8F
MSTPLAALLLAGLAVVGAPGAWARSPAKAAATSEVVLHCEAVYLPARQTWVREVRIAFDRHRVTAVEIDGQRVFSFSVDGTLLFTALDNERIRIDTAAQHWQSDFRGQAQSQGRCERLGG